jgi:rod shape-determining protein MreC
LAGGANTESSTLYAGTSQGAARLVFYLLAAVLLMALDHRGHYLDSLRSRLAVAVYPLVQSVELPARAARWLGQTFSDRTELNARNTELERRWLMAQAELNRMASLESENQRLRQLLETSPRLSERVLIAELLSVDLDPFSHRVALNKGRIDGVYQGQPLADAGGVIGQIESVTEFTAFAMLISDPSHAIPVAVNRTGLRTIVYGTGQTDELVLRDVSVSADIRAGDLLVTSGLGGRFPAGYPVAMVTEVLRNPGNAFLTVSARPTAALDRSREVLLVWPHIIDEARLARGEPESGAPEDEPEPTP